MAATIQQGACTGRGECTPYARYGESVESVSGAIESARRDRGGRRPRRAARPAAGRRGAQRAGLRAVGPRRQDHRRSGLSNRGPASPRALRHRLHALGRHARGDGARGAEAADRPVLKMKLAGEGDAARLAAVRAAAPEAELIVDANEAWRPETLDANFAACAEAGVALVEQPLPAGATIPRWRAGAGPSRSAPTRASTTARGSRPCADATTSSTSSSTRPAA